MLIKKIKYIYDITVVIAAAACKHSTYQNNKKQELMKVYGVKGTNFICKICKKTNIPIKNLDYQKDVVAPC